MTTAQETFLKTVREFEALPDGAVFWEGGGETGALLEAEGLITRKPFFLVSLVYLTGRGREALVVL